MDVPTDESIIWVTPDGENRIVSTDGAARSLSFPDVAPSLRVVTAGDVLLMQGNLGTDLTGAVLEAARSRGLVTILNVAPVVDGIAALFPLLGHAIVNEVEAEQLTGCGDPDAAVLAMRELGAGHVVVTLGASGARTDGPHGIETVPAEPVDAIDTTGAGDVLCGVYAASVAAGGPRPCVSPSRPPRSRSPVPGPSPPSLPAPSSQRSHPAWSCHDRSPCRRCVLR
jgi:ribokinase